MRQFAVLLLITTIAACAAPHPSKLHGEPFRYAATILEISNR